MARPKKDIQSLKAIRINVRMTVNDFLIVSDSANCLGIGIPEYIRRKTTGKAMPRTKVTPHDRQLFVALSRIGNNLNQLTKKAHLGMHTPKLLQKELLELKETIDQLKLNIVNK
ncbi:mobilization protein MobC [Mariniflexile fucanivorans]|uniref:Mobilization protein MobC n=1 Tax=Mariniflexile fucanivorans TaxID=264023 RepID=A0A4R1RJP8_9FLAO|nr:plasmid mobilization relaxosome protein MobC [Mariniflexile fucanivorans]TCL62666.1 mobilization protein MobC [Mariniflexile fucanivorans]TCL66020.1 mobilization protein MobC [Mariniflexile fucanivorans]